MADHPVEASPQVYARIGGVLYLIIILIGGFGEVFRDSLVVSGDAVASAGHIMAAELPWRIAIAGELVLLACATALTLIFYVLLRPVNRDLALLAVLFAMVSIIVEAAAALNLAAALFPLGSAEYLKAFDARQLAALAYLSLRAHGHGFGLGLVFFGFECLILGYLIFKSGYLPRFLGVLMPIAGVCYLINSFALIIAPALAQALFPAVLLPALVGEASFCLWLLFKGVDLPKWQARSAAARPGGV